MSSKVRVQQIDGDCPSCGLGPNAGIRSFDYTPAGHQTQVNSAGNVIDFAFDAAGRMSAADSANGTADFLYDGRSYLRQAGDLATVGTTTPTYDSAGRLHCLLKQPADLRDPTRYVILYLAGRPVGQVAVETGQADRWQFFTTDHLGTPLITTNATQADLWHNRFAPFGEDALAGTSGSALANEVFLRFPGQWEDASWQEATRGTAATYNLWRWYQASVARYMRPDPLGLRVPDGPFNYARANPIFFADPFGLCACSDDCPDGKWTYLGGSVGGAFLGGISFGRGFYQCDSNTDVEVKVNLVCAVIGFGAWGGIDLTTLLAPSACGCNKEDILGYSESWFGGLGPVTGSVSDCALGGSSGGLSVGASAAAALGWTRCRIRQR